MIKWLNDPKNETKGSWLMVIVPIALGIILSLLGVG